MAILPKNTARRSDAVDSLQAAAEKKVAPKPATVKSATPVVTALPAVTNYVPGFTPALETTQPVARATVPASSVGLGTQTTQPVASTKVTSASVPKLSASSAADAYMASMKDNQQKLFPDWGAYAEKYPEVVAEYNRTKPSMSLGTFAIQHYNTTGKAKGYDVPYLSQQAGYEKYFGAKSPSAYSETTTSYLKQLDDYIAGLGTPEYGGYRRDDPLLATYKSSPNYMGLITPSVQRSEADMLPYIGKPVAENTLYYFNTRTNQGDLSAPADVWVRSNTPLVLYDANKKEVVYAGTGVQAGQQIAKLSDQMSKTEGKKANWVIFQGEPGTTDTSKFTPVAYDTKDKGVLGQIADFALPIIGAIAVPGLGILGGPVGAAAGSAAGSALSGALQGEALNDILKKAAISGAATLAGGELLKGIGGTQPVSTGTITPSPAFTEAFSPDFMASLGGGATAGIGEGITVIGSKLAPSLTTGAVTGALSSGALSNALSNIAAQTKPTLPEVPAQPKQPAQPTQPTPTPEAPPIEVVAPKPTPVVPPVVTPPTGGLSAIGGATQPTQPTPTPEAPPIEVVAPKPTPVVPPIVPPVATPSPVNPSVPELTGNEITVSKPKPTDVGATAGSLIGGTSLLTPGQNAVVDQALAKETDPAKKSDLQKVIDYLRLGGLGVGLIGDLIGGKSTASPGIMPGGPGTLNPTFSAKLPSPNLPAATPRPATALPQTEQDWYRYGYGPEQSFFSNVPQGARNTSTAYTGYAEGGSTGYGQRSRSSFAVGGPGDGRDDKIPAVLSDGEYVMDAETVAMLGNGSSKAGAEALDRFRVNIRKHKGRDLAKGKFSANAKKPEQYLKGRK